MALAATPVAPVASIKPPETSLSMPLPVIAPPMPPRIAPSSGSPPVTSDLPAPIAALVPMLEMRPLPAPIASVAPIPAIASAAARPLAPALMPANAPPLNSNAPIPAIASAAAKAPAEPAPAPAPSKPNPPVAMPRPTKAMIGSRSPKPPSASARFDCSAGDCSKLNAAPADLSASDRYPEPPVCSNPPACWELNLSSNRFRSPHRAPCPTESNPIIGFAMNDFCSLFSDSGCS